MDAFQAHFAGFDLGHLVCAREAELVRPRRQSDERTIGAEPGERPA